MCLCKTDISQFTFCPLPEIVVTANEKVKRALFAFNITLLHSSHLWCF